MPKVYKVHYVRGGVEQKSWPRVYDSARGALAAERFVKRILEDLAKYQIFGEVFMEVAERTDWVREA